jgi:hypothetical protein
MIIVAFLYHIATALSVWGTPIRLCETGDPRILAVGCEGGFALWGKKRVFDFWIRNPRSNPYPEPNSSIRLTDYGLSESPSCFPVEFLGDKPKLSKYRATMYGAFLKVCSRRYAAPSLLLRLGNGAFYGVL